MYIIYDICKHLTIHPEWLKFFRRFPSLSHKAMAFITSCRLKWWRRSRSIIRLSYESSRQCGRWPSGLFFTKLRCSKVMQSVLPEIWQEGTVVYLLGFTNFSTGEPWWFRRAGLPRGLSQYAWDCLAAALQPLCPCAQAGQRERKYGNRCHISSHIQIKITISAAKSLWVFDLFPTMCWQSDRAS